MPPYRTDEARLDALVADSELRAAGVVEADEPTEYSHAAWMRNYYKAARGDFTPVEREQIRMHLGLDPFVAPAPSELGGRE